MVVKGQLFGGCSAPCKGSFLLACRQLRFTLYGDGYGWIPLLFLVSGSVEYPMHYAFCLASYSDVQSCFSRQLVCPDVLCLMQLSLSCGVLLKGALLV